MAQKRLTRAQFLERLLAIMDRKHHWAWPIIMGPGISQAQLKIHYQQEYLVYVRDFPVLLARVHGQNPPPDVPKNDCLACSSANALLATSMTEGYL